MARHWKVGAIGGALSMAAYGIAIYAMSQAFMAQVAALRETSVIFAAIFSAVILKERFHPRRYLASPWSRWGRCYCTEGRVAATPHSVPSHKGEGRGGEASGLSEATRRTSRS